MVGSSLAPKWPILVSFYGIHHQKSRFLYILAPFLSEAVEANRCYFFENWVQKLKCPHLLKPLGTIFQHNYWFFYTSEPFTLARFNMRHPVQGKTWLKYNMSEINRYVGIWYTLHKQHIHRREKCSNFIVRTWSGNGSPELLTCAEAAHNGVIVFMTLKSQ
jgi:hypothetical protein